MGILRWNYIKKINTIPCDYAILGAVKFERNFKNNLRTLIIAHPVTKIKRRVYTRRKHLYNWPAYFNLITRWSADYRFRSKYLSSLIEPNLFLYRYLIFNQLSTDSKNYTFLKVIAEFRAAALTKSTNSYFMSSGLVHAPYLPLRLTSFLHLTTWKSNHSLNSGVGVTPSLPFLKSGREFYGISDKPNFKSILLSLFMFIFQFYLKYIKAIYRISTLLTLKLLH